MKFQRLIWFIATIVFSILGLMSGYALGQYYIGIKFFEGSLQGKPAGAIVVVITTVCGGIILTRFGSWFADRFLINGMSRFQSISPLSVYWALSALCWDWYLLYLLHGRCPTVPIGLFS